MQPRRATSALIGLSFHLFHPFRLPYRLIKPRQATNKCSSEQSFYLGLHPSTSFAISCIPDEQRVLVWAKFSPHPLPLPPLPSQQAQTSYRCLSGLSFYLELHLDLPCHLMKLRGTFLLVWAFVHLVLCLLSVSEPG
jgi:hypothetical protein